LLALCGPAQAQMLCAPKTSVTPNEVGTIQVSGSDATGRWAYHWCPDAKPGFWRLQTFAVLRKYENTISDPLAVVIGILEAPDRLAAINQAVLGATVIPAPGSKDEYEWRHLLWAACTSAQTPPESLVPHVVATVAMCGAEPVPAVAPVVWKTPASGSSIYSAANGKLVSKIGLCGITCGNLHDVLYS
jgi:hypothetical protein